MIKTLRASVVGLLIASGVCLICQAAPRKPLLRPTPEVAVAEGHGSVNFDPTTGKYKVQIATPNGPSEFTYELRTNVDVIVEAVVSHDPKTGVYDYEYAVVSAQTSRQRVRKLSVWCEEEPVTMRGPEGWQPSRRFGRKIVSWFDKDDARAGIPPGGHIAGFRIAMQGRNEERPTTGEQTVSLPGIVRTAAAGDVRATSIPHLEWIGEGVFTRPGADQDMVSGKTVGPVKVPIPLLAADHVQRINEYVQISVGEGWIVDDEVAASYADALRAIEEANSRAAGANLKASVSKLIKQADRDLASGKITSEAYALLRFNAQELKAR